MSYTKTPLIWKLIPVLAIGFFFGWQSHAWDTSSGDTATQDTESVSLDEADMYLFWDVWGMVSDQYADIDQSTEQDRVYGAISGMVDALGDPYSVFMAPEENEQFQSSLNGDLEGIGAELTVEDGKLIIVAPLKDSPAQEAGILTGDYIYLVDDEPTGDMTLWEAIMKIRGTPGTDVKLTILREGEKDPLEITITRQHIDVPSVEISYEQEVGKSIAHLEVYQFGDDTYTEFEEAIRDMTLHGADGLVLDLRMNGGGYLDVSIDMLSEFFSDARTGVIVKRRNQENELLKTLGKGQFTEIPMVVLIDGGSASASEIVAGALQDYGRAVLMGTQSFGKGSVQELHPLKDGSSLRLTIAKWYTPSDRGINKVGITPDTVVDMDPADRGSDNDIQFKAALDYLSNL